MNEITCFVSGIAFAVFGCHLLTLREWRNRQSIERRVDRLYEHLSCGNGILGCKEGKNCRWDHK